MYTDMPVKEVYVTILSFSHFSNASELHKEGKRAYAFDVQFERPGRITIKLTKHGDTKIDGISATQQKIGDMAFATIKRLL